MKFYEVVPNISLTQHAITVRPIGFSGKTFRRLPADLQDCVMQGGTEGGKLGRQTESSEDPAKLAKMESAGLLKTHEFRSEERRAGKTCATTCRSRRSPYHYKQNDHHPTAAQPTTHHPQT